MGTIVIVDGPTILAGQSLSEGISLQDGTMVRITVPQEFTPSLMTFQGSSDGEFFNDLYDSSGREIQITAGPDRGILLNEARWRSVKHVKLRSGSGKYPVAQKVDCKFAIAVEVEATP